MIAGHRKWRPTCQGTLLNNTRRHTIAVANSSFPELFLEGTDTTAQKNKSSRFRKLTL
jgi:hypothetical protein